MKGTRVAKTKNQSKGNIVDDYSAIQIYEKSTETIKIVERKRKNDDEMEISIEKKRVRASRQRKGNKFPSISTRGSPQILTEVLKTMNGAKEEALRQMGFGWLKNNFDFDSAPSRLAYWVTFQFDPETCNIKMANGSSLKITSNLIHEVLGIPNGGIPIVPVNLPTTEDYATRVFRKKYKEMNLKSIFIKTVEDQLKISNEVDFAFKLDFLCLFCSLMGKSTAFGTVNQLFFPSITSEDMICNLDWCSYLLETLRSSRRKWNGKTTFKGSSFLLTLLYVHSTNSMKCQPERTYPAISNWNTSLLLLRQSEEEARGKFGDLPIAEGFEDDDKKMRTIFTKAVEEMLDREDEDIIINRNYEERGLKGMKKNMNANFELIKILKENFESNLDKGRKNNPEDEWFKEMKVNWDSLFKKPMHSEEEFQNYVHKKEIQKNYEQEYEMYDGPSFSLGFTREEIQQQLQQEAKEEDEDDDEQEQQQQQQQQQEEEKEQEDGVIIINRKYEERGLKLGQQLPRKASTSQCSITCVQGYEVKESVAPILEAIFKKHGDIAAECIFIIASVRASLLEVVCEVVRQIQANDAIEKIEEIESHLSQAEAAKIDVSWLRAHLETKVNTVLVQKDAQMDLRERCAELVTAQERFKEAERWVRVLHLVEKKLNNNILDSEG